MSLSNIKLNLNNDRIQEAKERKLSLYLTGKADRTPVSFSVSGFESTSPNKEKFWNFIEKLEHPEYVIESTIEAANYQSKEFPDSDWIPTIPTYHLGEGVIASMFGATQLPNEYNPPYQPDRILKSIEDVETLEERFDPNSGYGKKYKDLVMMSIEATDGQIPVEIHDHQSPYGIATKLINNEDLMFAMYDEPELVHKLMDIVTNAMIASIKNVMDYAGAENIVLNSACQVTNGEAGIIIWDDYISVISPAMHDEFCRPYNERLYKEFGVGHLHTCGPYFPNFIDACIKHDPKPKSMDITAMRNLTKTREDMLEFRRITKENGIIINGGFKANNVSICDNDNWEDIDKELFFKMADGGLLMNEWGSKELGEALTAWSKEFGPVEVSR